MGRRQFILGSATVALLLPARAEQPERVRRIGVPMTIAADDAEARVRLATLRARLEQLGCADGGNVQIDTRFGGGGPDRIRKSAAELVALAPDVIVADNLTSQAGTKETLCGLQRICQVSEGFLPLPASQ